MSIASKRINAENEVMPTTCLLSQYLCKIRLICLSLGQTEVHLLVIFKRFPKELRMRLRKILANSAATLRKDFLQFLMAYKCANSKRIMEFAQ